MGTQLKVDSPHVLALVRHLWVEMRLLGFLLLAAVLAPSQATIRALLRLLFKGSSSSSSHGGSPSYGAPRPSYGAPKPSYGGDSQPSHGSSGSSGHGHGQMTQPDLQYGFMAMADEADQYGSPAAPVEDQYGSPAAPIQDEYGSPAPADDQYGSPAAPAQDQYGSPAPADDQYGSPA